MPGQAWAWHPAPGLDGRNVSTVLPLTLQATAGPAPRRRPGPLEFFQEHPVSLPIASPGTLDNPTMLTASGDEDVEDFGSRYI